jgi:hypothetical protein
VHEPNKGGIGKSQRNDQDVSRKQEPVLVPDLKERRDPGENRQSYSGANCHAPRAKALASQRHHEASVSGSAGRFSFPDEAVDPSPSGAIQAAHLEHQLPAARLPHVSGSPIRNIALKPTGNPADPS